MFKINRDLKFEMKCIAGFKNIARIIVKKLVTFLMNADKENFIRNYI